MLTLFEKRLWYRIQMGKQIKNTTPLLSKTTKPFLVFVLIVLAISIPVYYWVVDSIWKNELDGHNKTIAKQTAKYLNQSFITDKQLEQYITLWNQLQPNTHIQALAAGDLPKDSVYTSIHSITNQLSKGDDRFRCLSKVIKIHHRPYRFRVQANIEESKETIGVIAMVTFAFFIILVIGFLWMTKRLSKVLWQPFRDTLFKLKAFNLSTQTQVDFETTSIKEFEELNQSLRKLINHAVGVYQLQKEFTENAAHELQTPLAILKNKLDLLLQSESLTDEQYQIAEEMHKALSRGTRLQKNLLLLAKIDNSQFAPADDVHLDEMLQQNIESLQEHIHSKGMILDADNLMPFTVKANHDLVEIMINNLLLNAIRYTPQNGNISVSLNEQFLKISNTGDQPLNKEMLFKRFSRIATDKNGTGLGLAIVKEICSLHQWTIVYRFEEGRHSFVLHFLSAINE